MTSMTKPLLGLALAGALAWVSTAAAQERPTAFQPPTVRRTTLVVEDLARSVDFYQRLGLSKVADMTTDATSPGGVIGADSLPLTEDPKQGRLVVLRGADERTGQIGLLGYDKPKLASARSNLMGIGTGDLVLVMEVTDLQAIYSRLQQIDVRFHRTPGKYSMTTPDGATATGQRMFVYDPDGRLIEVLQPDRPR